MILLSSTLHAQDKFTYSGYTKDLVSVVNIKDIGTTWDNLLHNRAMMGYQIDTSWSVRGELRTRFFYGDQVTAPGFDSLVNAGSDDVLDLSLDATIGDKGYLHTYFDRLYVQYAKAKLEARLGRQRINWGINTLWNPNDIFNAYSFTDFDYEERPGSDAIRVRYYTGDLSSIEIAGKLGNDTHDGAIAALWRTHLGTYDLQVLTGYLTRSENIVFGGGWAGNLKNWGFKGEGSVFIPTNSDDDLGASVSIGLDYIFPNSLLIGFGGLYNALGRTSGGLSELFIFQPTARDLYPFRWTVNATAGYPVHPLVNTALTVVYSIADSHPVFLSPVVTWSAFENIDIDLVGQIIFQDDNGSYGSPIQAGFLRVKWSY